MLETSCTITKKPTKVSEKEREEMHRFVNLCFFKVACRVENHDSSLQLFFKTVTEQFKIPRDEWKKTVFVFIQHFFVSFIDIPEFLINEGVPANQIFALSKPYSRNEDIAIQLQSKGVNVISNSSQLMYGGCIESFIRDIGELWRKISEFLKTNSAVKRIIMVDHGGHGLIYTPPELSVKYFIVGIEHTSAGLFSLDAHGLSFHVIEMATSAVKKKLESIIIAKELTKILLSKINLDIPENWVCGIVGYGAIGKALAEKLVSLGYRVIAYDVNNEIYDRFGEVKYVANLNDLIISTNVIFGCTGRDITDSMDWIEKAEANQEKYLISCSSEDKEFSTLIKTTQKQQRLSGIRSNGNHVLNGIKKTIDPYADLVYMNGKGARITIKNGEFPINLRGQEISTKKEISITTGATIGAIMQAMEFGEEQPVNNYMLNSAFQSKLSFFWADWQEQKMPQKLVQKFEDLNWIRGNSGSMDSDKLTSQCKFT